MLGVCVGVRVRVRVRVRVERVGGCAEVSAGTRESVEGVSTLYERVWREWVGEWVSG